MSADALRTAVIEAFQKEADDTASRMLNVAITQGCEQIALNVAGLRGMALALGRAMEIIDTEYKKLMEPEEAAPAKKARELY